ncbi:MAG: aldehyde dehydrogenase family protein [Phycisphaerales bacterium]|nr:aldehyde dehydrogenase family protein [Phycisphaerales bacterium]
MTSPASSNHATSSTAHAQLFSRLGLDRSPRVSMTAQSGPLWIASENPTTAGTLAWVKLDTAADYERQATEAVESFKRWRSIPAPARGLVVRAIGDAFRTHKHDLGELVSLEVGKIRSEGQGEIQEIVDIADFAVGLSRQLPGLTLPSERAGHRLIEQWLPLGVVGVISAFNFPAAVWAWNACLAAVAGDVTLWKPSLLAPLTAIACNRIADEVATSMGHPGVFRLIIGTDTEVGESMIADKRLPLISATGSCRMGKRVGAVVAQRLGRSLLELGGNNACIVHKDADLDLTLPAIVFGAVGTAGQRCTTTRRLIIHESIADTFVQRLTKAYQSLESRIGDPLKDGTLIGPLVNAKAVEQFEHAVAQAKAQGAQILAGGSRAERSDIRGHFVRPTLIKAPASNTLPIALEETFAPILYVFTYRELDEAIAMQNSVDQGLSSSVFTESVRVSERFLHPDGSGSDCGIANVNCGTSGAEIGGAFGGEKETGGGRESGSDSWKAYMRRQTCTINFSGKLELAQGIRFE